MPIFSFKNNPNENEQLDEICLAGIIFLDERVWELFEETCNGYFYLTEIPDPYIVNWNLVEEWYHIVKIIGERLFNLDIKLIKQHYEGLDERLNNQNNTLVFNTNNSISAIFIASQLLRYIHERIGYIYMFLYRLKQLKETIKTINIENLLLLIFDTHKYTDSDEHAVIAYYEYYRILRDKKIFKIEEKEKNNKIILRILKESIKEIKEDESFNSYITSNDDDNIVKGLESRVTKKLYETFVY